MLFTVVRVHLEAASQLEAVRDGKARGETGLGRSRSGLRMRRRWGHDIDTHTLLLYSTYGFIARKKTSTEPNRKLTMSSTLSSLDCASQRVDVDPRALIRIPPPPRGPTQRCCNENRVAIRANTSMYPRSIPEYLPCAATVSYSTRDYPNSASPS